MATKTHTDADTVASFDKIRDVFSDCQSGHHSLASLIKAMTKIYGSVDDDTFFSNFVNNVKYFLIIFKREPAVERTIDFLAKFCTSLQTAQLQAAEAAADSEDKSMSLADASTCHPFLLRFCQFLLENHKARDKAVRFRVCQLINKLFAALGDDAAIDDSLYEGVYQAMQIRLRDKYPVVRVHAVLALARLQDPGDPECHIIDAFKYMLEYDLNPEVRCAVLSAIAATTRTVRVMLERTRDSKEVVRRLAYQVIANKIHVRALTIAQRVRLLRQGLDDHIEAVREACMTQLVAAWLRMYNGNRLAVLGLLDVENSLDVCQQLLGVLFQKSTALELTTDIEFLTKENVIVADKLSSESAVYWRCLCEHLRSLGAASDEFVDKVIPSGVIYAKFLRSVADRLKAHQKLDEQLRNEFILQQLVHLVSSLDLTDEVARKHVVQVLRDLLLNDTVTHTVVRAVFARYSALNVDGDAFMANVAEIISDIRKPITQDLGLSRDERRQIDVKTDSQTLLKCLSIVSELLTESRFKKLTPSLQTLTENLILPGIQNANPAVRNQAVKSLGLCSLRSVDLARERLILLLQVSRMDQDVVRISALQAIFDLLRFFGLEAFKIDSTLTDKSVVAQKDDGNASCGSEDFDDHSETSSKATPAEKPGADIMAILTHLLDHNNSQVRTVCAEGFSKLLLAGRVVSPSLLSRLLLLSYNPVTEDDTRLRHCIGTFLPLYSFASRSNQEQVAEAIMPTLRTLFDAPATSPLVANVADLLVELTDINHPMAAFIDKDESPHDNVAIKIANEILSNPNNFDARVLVKVLCSLRISATNENVLKNLKVLCRRILKEMKDKQCSRSLEKFTRFVRDKLQKLKQPSSADGASDAEDIDENEQATQSDCNADNKKTHGRTTNAKIKSTAVGARPRRATKLLMSYSQLSPDEDEDFSISEALDDDDLIDTDSDFELPTKPPPKYTATKPTTGSPVARNSTEQLNTESRVLQRTPEDEVNLLINSLVAKTVHPNLPGFTDTLSTAADILTNTDGCIQVIPPHSPCAPLVDDVHADLNWIVKDESSLMTSCDEDGLQCHYNFRKQHEVTICNESSPVDSRCDDSSSQVFDSGSAMILRDHKPRSMNTAQLDHSYRAAATAELRGRKKPVNNSGTSTVTSTVAVETSSVESRNSFTQQPKTIELCVKSPRQQRDVMEKPSGRIGTQSREVANLVVSAGLCSQKQPDIQFANSTSSTGCDAKQTTVAAEKRVTLGLRQNPTKFVAFQAGGTLQTYHCDDPPTCSNHNVQSASAPVAKKRRKGFTVMEESATIDSPVSAAPATNGVCPSSTAAPLNTAGAAVTVDDDPDLVTEFGTFARGSLVWAHLGSGRHRWWPAVTVEPVDCYKFSVKPKHHWIFWLGNHKVSEVQQCRIAPFVSLFSQKFSSGSKLLNKAIIEAIQEQARRQSVTLSDSVDAVLHWATTDMKDDDTQSPVATGLKLPDWMENKLEEVRELVKRAQKDSDCSDNNSSSSNNRNIGPLNNDICLSCGSQGNNFVGHPMFVGGLCPTCLDEFLLAIFRLGSDGINMYCVICSNGGKMFVCEKPGCCKLYCTECVQRLMGDAGVRHVRNTDPWHCYLCSPADELACGLLVGKPDWRRNLVNLLVPPDYIARVSPVVERHSLRVLSLFDGIGTGKIVLDELNLDVEVYFASEINNSAIAVTQARHGTAVTQIGDVRDITYDKLKTFCPIDLLIGGSPCNEFSVANPNRRGLEAGAGLLFFEFHRILTELRSLSQPDRPVFWLFENVASMQQETRQTISRFLRCQPTVWDAKDFTAMRRSRYFWGNIPDMFCPLQFSDHWDQRQQVNPPALFPSRRMKVAKLRTITTKSNSLMQAGRDDDAYPVELDSGAVDTLWTPEIERLFGFPSHYTDIANLSRVQRHELLGQAWCVPVVKHLLTPLRNYFSHSTAIP